MLAALDRIFHDHEQHDGVRFEYDTELYFGHVTGKRRKLSSRSSRPCVQID